MATEDPAPTTRVRTRYAPSPTGHLHVGGCRTAIFAWALARHHGGDFLLRIEDTDKEREVPGSLETIQEDLRWLGLHWDEGPDVGGPYGPYIQSQRLPLYQRHADELVRAGKAYRCYCSKERLEEMRQAQTGAGLPTGYDRRCRALSDEERRRLDSEGRTAVIRIAMPVEGATTFDDALRGPVRFDNRALDDFVAIKSDGFPTYNFANVVDDHEMRISHVIRGEEFISSTPKFAVVYGYLGWAPPILIHVPLVLGPNRQKLAKRHGDTSVVQYAREGYLPDALVNFLALLGWSAGEDREILSREEMVERFTLDRFQKHAAIFDLTKLDWMNGEYIRALPSEDLARMIRPWLVEAGLFPADPSESQLEYLSTLTPMIQERLKRLAEAPGLLDFFLKDEVEYDPAAVRKRLSDPAIPELLERVADSLDRVAVFGDAAAVEAAVREAGDAAGFSGGALNHPVRVAVTGRGVGPSLYHAVSALGRERSQTRLRAAARLARSLDPLGSPTA